MEVIDMPGKDGTGPNGMGPMTGGGRGFCAIPVSDGVRPFAGRMFGGRGFMGRGGRGRGYRHCFYASGLPGWVRTGYYPLSNQYDTNTEMEVLKDESELLKQELEEIQNRISSLESKKTQGNK